MNMRTSLILVFLLIFSGLIQAQKKDSVYLFCYFKGGGDGLHFASSEDGFVWNSLFHDSAVLKPTVSKDKLFRDPSIVQGKDGIFHMVWTVSWNDRGIGYASSSDLIHWSEQQYLPLMQQEDSARNAWAPELTYDKDRKEFIIYWATTIKGRFVNKDSAAESGYNHRIYFVTTKDFKKFSPARLLYEPGFSVIDASIVRAGKEWLMFLKNETRSPVEKNIRVARAKRSIGPYSAASAPITGNYWAEGPAPLQLGNQWIVYFDKYRDHKYGAVISSDLKHWTDVSSQVKFPAGVRHGTAFKVSRKYFERFMISGNLIF
jgi:hypothetical protein